MKRLLATIVAVTAIAGSLSAKGGKVVRITHPGSAVSSMNMADTRYIIRCVVDLGGKELIMPEGCTLEFARGGQIASGHLVGNDTRIKGKTRGIFCDIRISGSFDVPEINSRMLADATRDNALADLLALASPDRENTVTIESLPGGAVYNVSTLRGRDIVKVPSNTHVILHGTVRMAPCSEESYGVFSVDNAENVSFSGDGVIIGDRAAHTGTSGEWGMGISIVGSRNVHVTGLTIRDCWGDCIYVGRSRGKQSRDVTIDNCFLSGSRRQGISVVSCYGSTLKDLEIRDIRGTDPQSAIDIEPNAGDTCSAIRIERIIVRNCCHGILSTTPGDEISKITDITVRDCDIESEVLGLGADHCDLFDVKDTRVLTCYSGFRSHISTVRIDNCYFGPPEGKELGSGIVVLWDVFLDVRNSEFHAGKFLDNPKATPASKRMYVAGNTIHAPVEMKIQASRIVGNTVYGNRAPLMGLILGEGNDISGNTLVYTGEGRPDNLLDVQTDNNTVTGNEYVYRPSGEP